MKPKGWEKEPRRHREAYYKGKRASSGDKYWFATFEGSRNTYYGFGRTKDEAINALIRFRRGWLEPDDTEYHTPRDEVSAMKFKFGKGYVYGSYWEDEEK